MGWPLAAVLIVAIVAVTGAVSDYFKRVYSDDEGEEG